MNWICDAPLQGDIIRVKVKFYYHYGIYVSGDEIIQFGLPDNEGINPDEIEVLSTDINTFLNGGNLETAKLTFHENIKRRSRKATVEYARGRIGQKGYNILHNNCEHFASECVFGKRKSDLLENVRQEIHSKIDK